MIGPNRVHLSDGTAYDAELCVYRDWINSAAGHWRLFWLRPGTSSGVDVDSEVTGFPFFRTMADAVASGRRRFGITARRAPELD